MLRSSMFLACVMLASLPGCASRGDRSFVPPPDLSFDAAGEHWLKHGVQVGDRVPYQIVYTINGERVPLSTLWRHKPALLVTTSMTCPVARERCRQLASIIDTHGRHVNVALLYTLEAHPAGEECPYKPGEEWLTRANEEQGVYFPQPKSLEQRLVLAREMKTFLGVKAPMYVDTMSNRAWLALGAGPNLAVLVDTDSTVLAKQGWLDVEALAPVIDQLVTEGSVLRVQSPEEQSLRQYLALRNRGQYAMLERHVAPDARIWFGEKTGEGSPKTHETGWGAWDREMHARNTIEELTIEDDRIVTIMHEENDYSRLIGFPGWRSRSTFWFDEQHRITEQFYEPLPQHPSQKECFVAPLAWLREHRPDALADVYPDDRIEPSAAAARAWRALLIDWRRAAELPIPGDVAARAR